MSRGLRPIRDLRGTGMMPQQSGKKKGRLKAVGHLLDQVNVRKVSDRAAWISEPSTRAGRIKARANRAMFGFSPSNRRDVMAKLKVIFARQKARLLKWGSID